jgi:glycosyltransferase involved in cell wall biosynthesis
MLKIGFVSTRFAGADGVSLESEKWARMLEENGHEVFWFAGQLDRDAAVSMLVPEAFFEHPDNEKINATVWGRLDRPVEINALIKTMAEDLKAKLYDFVKRFGVGILLPENALTIPMHVPLGLAITDFIAETGMPTIAHHHDFYWERTRFTMSGVRDYLEMAFPPVLPQVQHAVINSVARDQLAWRKGVASIVVPNVLDFENPPHPPHRELTAIRASIGIAPDDILILQPTRVVPRKGIEHAIAVVSRLRNPKCKLVISHESGDEGDAYLHALCDMAEQSGVDLRLVKTVASHFSRGEPDPTPEGSVSLWELYPCADLVTYPSLYEGFGNALLEAFYFKVPVLINRYSIWIQDIEPKGFRTITMDGYVTKELVQQIDRILCDRELRTEVAERNYMLATRYYSYAVLRRRLQTLVINVMGLD